MPLKILFSSFSKLLIVIVFFFFQDVKAQTFSLNGIIRGRDSGYVKLRYFRDSLNRNYSDTAIIKQGKFQFTGSVIGAELGQLTISPSNNTKNKSNYKVFFIEPGLISISFDDGEADKAVIVGSASQKQYESLERKVVKERIELKEMNRKYKYIDSVFKNGLINTKKSEESREKVAQMYKHTYEIIRENDLLFLRENPKSYVSMLLLYDFVGRLPDDSIDNMYARLSDKIKGSTIGNNFLEYNSKYRKAMYNEYPFDKLIVNEKAPSFIIRNDLTGDSITLETYRGEIVLLEFWGLYCIPCLYANPYLEQIRAKFVNKGFKIISITNNMPEDIPELVAYIQKNKFNEWYHATLNSMVKQNENLFMQADFSKYVGLGVPRTVVIDRKGNLIYKHADYSPEEMKRLEAVIDIAINQPDKE